MDASSNKQHLCTEWARGRGPAFMFVSSHNVQAPLNLRRRLHRVEPGKFLVLSSTPLTLLILSLTLRISSSGSDFLAVPYMS